MKCFHAHTPSHSPTPSHMPMSSVVTVTGNANDAQIPNLCRLTNTQCNLPMGNPSQVNPDSYHSNLGLSDKHDRVFSFGQQNFSAYTVGLLHPHRTSRISSRVSYTHTEISDISTGLLHPYNNFGYLRGSLTPIHHSSHLRGFTAPFLLRPTHVNFNSLI